jgi:hypothetical protein
MSDRCQPLKLLIIADLIGQFPGFLRLCSVKGIVFHEKQPTKNDTIGVSPLATPAVWQKCDIETKSTNQPAGGSSLIPAIILISVGS